MGRRQGLVAWTRENIHLSDGPQAGQRIRLEKWQRDLLTAIDREKRTTYVLRCASQIGKTTAALAVGLRTAVDGAGTLIASATIDAVKDARRRLDAIVGASPAIGDAFLAQRSGPGARSSWNLRETQAGGFVSLAGAGSPARLSARTVRVAVCDEVARWPRTVRSGEAAPLQLVEARTQDWGDDAVRLLLSSPTDPHDQIEIAFRDGDQRRLEYSCPDCGQRTPFLWEHVTGREKGETPAIACAACGVAHGEAARRRMLRSARWVAQRRDPTDEECASFAASRLDSARASLDQVVRSWRKARLRVERGDDRALGAWENLVLGVPRRTAGAVNVDALYESARDRRFDFAAAEQAVGGVDVQDAGLYWAVAVCGPRLFQVVDFGHLVGDPREDAVWQAVESAITAAPAPMPRSIVTVDAGFLTSQVVAQCRRRRWWIPAVGRAGEGKPIARPMGRSGLATVGTDAAKAMLVGMATAGRLRWPMKTTRRELRECVASETLVSEAGALRWRPVPGVANHYLDTLVACLHGRHFRTITGRRRPVRLRAV